MACFSLTVYESESVYSDTGSSEFTMSVEDAYEISYYCKVISYFPVNLIVTY